jgi:hypothetical protein
MRTLLLLPYRVHMTHAYNIMLCALFNLIIAFSIGTPCGP